MGAYIEKKSHPFHRLPIEIHTLWRNRAILYYSSFYLRRTAFLVFFPETWILLFPFLTLFSIRAVGTKRSPLRRLSIITLVRKLTTLLKSPGSIFPRTLATFKAFLVIPASSAMSFTVYRYSLLGLYAGWDPFLGIFTSSGSPSIGRVLSEWHRLFSILMTICKEESSPLCQDCQPTYFGMKVLKKWKGRSCLLLFSFLHYLASSPHEPIRLPFLENSKNKDLIPYLFVFGSQQKSTLWIFPLLVGKKCGGGLKSIAWSLNHRFPIIMVQRKKKVGPTLPLPWSHILLIITWNPHADEAHVRVSSSRSLFRASPDVHPGNPPNPCWNGFQTNPRSCAKIPLTHNCLFCIFNPPQSEFLSNGFHSFASFFHWKEGSRCKACS